MRAILLSFVAAITVLPGCAPVLPTAEYRKIGSGQDMQGMTDAFYLQANSIDIKEEKSEIASSGTGQKKDDLIASTLNIDSRREASDVKLGIKSVSSWRAETKLNLTKIDNTDVVQSVGVEVTDKTAQAITDYGGAVVKVLTSAAVLGVLEAKQQCIFPITVQVRPKLGRTDPETIEQACVKVVLGPVPVDAVGVDSIAGGETSNYYYSACRDAVVWVNTDPAQLPRSAKVRVADPRFVQRVQFPAKGMINHHSQCGVSVVTEAVAADHTAAIWDALATQAKTIKEAWDTAHKD